MTAAPGYMVEVSEVPVSNEPPSNSICFGGAVGLYLLAPGRRVQIAKLQPVRGQFRTTWSILLFSVSIGVFTSLVSGTNAQQLPDLETNNLLVNRAAFRYIASRLFNIFSIVTTLRWYSCLSRTRHLLMNIAPVEALHGQVK